MRIRGHVACFTAIAAAFLAATPSQAYYHYLRYYSSGAPYTPVPLAFDLAALPEKTVTFFVHDSGLAGYGRNDSFASVLSQVKQAAAAWNGIAASDLRVAFGGIGTSGNTPGGDVVFEELPPGLLGIGTPTPMEGAGVINGQNGPFLPIARGTVILTNNTSSDAGGPGPSYLEAYYATAVHEFGHALGLQHTWTGSAMSQDVIRNTSRSRPVDGDDIAAICVLYGTPTWKSATGSISGTVLANGQPWHMASVVAIPTLGPAISTLTNPDGTYTINGLPPGQYMLYAHPLPQDAIQANDRGLAPPQDAQGRNIAPSSGFFQTAFYPGVTDIAEATTFSVSAGDALTAKDFFVQKRTSTPVYDLVTFTFLDPGSRTFNYSDQALWVSPAYANINQSNLRIFAQPNASNTTPLATSATLLGQGTGTISSPNRLQLFRDPDAGTLLLMDFPNLGGVSAGPRHLVLTFNTSQGPDMYVLPNAITVVRNGPPVVESVTPNDDGSVTVTGSGLTPDSRVFFDGLAAAVLNPFVPAAGVDVSTGSITVKPPQGASEQVATVTVYTADNQNSMLLQGVSPVTYVYPPAVEPRIVSVYPGVLPAGSNGVGTAAMIEINAQDSNFVDGQVTVGFGTSDLSVRRLWVMGPTRLIADVVVGTNATVGSAAVNVISGFQVMTTAGAFQIQAPDPSLPAPVMPVVNAVTYAPVLHGSDYASIFGVNLGDNSAQVLLGGIAMPVLYSASGQINFQIPASIPAGPTTLEVNSGTAKAFPIMVQIDSPPAVISVPLQGSAGTALDGPGVTNPGDIVNLQVTNVDPAIVTAPGRLQVTMGGVPMTVLNVAQADDGSIQIQFAVTQSFAGWQVPLVLSVDGSPSLALLVTAR